MTKLLFIQTMKAIKRQDEHDVKCSELIAQVYDVFEANAMYKNSHLGEALVKLLEVVLQDGSGLIRYFIAELNFGKDYKEGDVSANGQNINLSTAGNLYEYLMGSKEAQLDGE